MNEEQRKGWKTNERTNNNLIRIQTYTKSKKNPFTDQWEIKYIVSYAAIPNNSTMKTTGQDKK